MSTAIVESRLGTTLRGKYRLERILGVGGMAAVYAALHRNGYRVAVKILHPWAAADPAIVKRFVREGYIANAIEHPSAVHVLDDDVAEDGSIFLVMELLRGRALADCIGAGVTPPLDAALDAIDQLLDVLVAAHAKQIVHRDLKPENVFVTESGRIKLLDLGIARMRGLTGSVQTTRSGLLMGTPGYMAPEQALGMQDKIDARTDLWAVGAMMHFLFTGRLVHEAETAEQTMLRAATTPVPPLASIAPRIPARIGAVVDRALAMSSDDRWQDAREMRAALSAARSASRLDAFEAGQPLVRLMTTTSPAMHAVRAVEESLPTVMSTARSVSTTATPTRPRRAWAVALAAAAMAAAVGFAVHKRTTTTTLSASIPEPPAETSVSLPEPPVPAALVAQPAASAATATPSASTAPQRRAPARRSLSKTPRQATPTPAPPSAPEATDPFDRP